MKLIKIGVNCRGCQKGVALDCEYPGLFSTRHVPFKCARCGSKLVAEIRRHLFSKKLDCRVKMVEHTKTLLNILKRRGPARPNA